MSGNEPAPKGFPALAQIMAADNGTAIFKRFSELQMNSLLIQQAELLHLQHQLRKMEKNGQACGTDINKQYLKLVETGSASRSQNLNSARPGSPQATTEPSQWDVHMSIRDKLKDYNEALLQLVEVNKLPKPQAHDISVLRQWYENEHGGDNFFRGVDELDWVFPDDDASDLVAAATRNFDLTTRFAAEKVVPYLFRRGLQRKEYVFGDEKLGLVKWNDITYEATSRWLTVITSAFMPCLAIIVLYYIPKLIHRIIVATCFTFLFSTAIALLTFSRPPEIFAATVGFSAVEVVFIGSTGSNSTA